MRMQLWFFLTLFLCSSLFAKDFICRSLNADARVQAMLHVNVQTDPDTNKLVLRKPSYFYKIDEDLIGFRAGNSKEKIMANSNYHPHRYKNHQRFKLLRPTDHSGIINLVVPESILVPSMHPIHVAMLFSWIDDIDGGTAHLGCSALSDSESGLSEVEEGYLSIKPGLKGKNAKEFFDTLVANGIRIIEDGVLSFENIHRKARVVDDKLGARCYEVKLLGKIDYKCDNPDEQDNISSENAYMAHDVPVVIENGSEFDRDISRTVEVKFLYDGRIKCTKTVCPSCRPSIWYNCYFINPY